jgi:hypothetical protein
VMIASRQSVAKRIARTSLAFYIRDESRPLNCELVVLPVNREGRGGTKLAGHTRAGQDAMQDSLAPSGRW